MVTVCNWVVVAVGFPLVFHFIGTIGQPLPMQPKPSESYSAEYTRAGLGTQLRARIYRNFDEGKQLIVQPIGVNDGHMSTLSRSDLKKEYKYFQPYAYCSVKSVQNPMEIRAWDWIRNTKYQGMRRFQQQSVYIWAYNNTQIGVYSEVGVSVEDYNKLVFVFDDPLSSTSSNSFGLTVFETFVNAPPPASVFEVPEVCSDL